LSFWKRAYIEASGGEAPTRFTQRAARMTEFTGDPFCMPGQGFNLGHSSPAGCYPQPAFAEESTQERASGGAP